MKFELATILVISLSVILALVVFKVAEPLVASVVKLIKGKG